MTPSTSKPAKLLTSLWIRLSCGEGGGAGEGAACRGGQRVKKEGKEAKPVKRKKISFTPLHEGTTQHFDFNFSVVAFLAIMQKPALFRSIIGQRLY